MVKDFTGLKIREALVKALHETGVVEPTPIQEKAIPILLNGQDIIAQAQTGTGKTLAFVLPILEAIDLNKSAVQALIVTPTRELAIQIAAEIKKLAPVVGANVLAAYGGQDVERQIHKLKGDIHIVIGTPGRLLDHLRRETVNFGKLDQLVLDEADQMLHMGFLAEVEEIIAQTPTRRQTMLFSATMPAPIRSLAKQYMKEPVEIQIEAKRVTLDEIEQVVVETTDRNKQNELVQLIQQYNPYLAMVFCRTKRRAGALNKALQELGFSSDELHGDLSQAKREQVMKRFREARIQILVATDMAARGIDVEGITHVFNFDIPHDVESYIHRIGRTGRAGKKGMAITFATSHDRAFLEQIEHGIQQSLGGNRTKQGGIGRNGESSKRTSGVRAQRGGSARNGEGGSRNTGERAQRGGSARNGESGARAAGERAQRGGSARNGEGGARTAGERAQRGGSGRNGESGARAAGERAQRGGSGRNGERSAAADGGRQGSANFGNAASRVRGGAAAPAGAAQPLGRRGALAAAKNDVAWGRKPEGDLVEPKRGGRAWQNAAPEPRTGRAPSAAGGRPKAARGASSPYSPYTASNGRKDSTPKRNSDAKGPRRGK